MSHWLTQSMLLMCNRCTASRRGRTSGVCWHSQPLDVQGAADVILYGSLVAPHYRPDGLSQTAQVVEDLQGCPNLAGVLTQRQSENRRGDSSEPNSWNTSRSFSSAQTDVSWHQSFIAQSQTTWLNQTDFQPFSCETCLFSKKPAFWQQKYDLMRSVVATRLLGNSKRCCAWLLLTAAVICMFISNAKGIKTKSNTKTAERTASNISNKEEK